MEFPTSKEYIAIIDFEATCTDKKEFPRKETEIIEFACIVIDKNLNEIQRFGKFVRPILHPQLTSFCKRLTSISQENVDTADRFPEVLNEFKEEIIKPYNPLFASWGRYDKNQLRQDCHLHKVEYPFDEEHLDIKRWIPRFYRFEKPKGIGAMLKYLKMNFEGTHHRGIDDVSNIIRILRKTDELIRQRD